jgi:hypothetical protein
LGHFSKTHLVTLFLGLMMLNNQIALCPFVPSRKVDKIEILVFQMLPQCKECQRYVPGLPDFYGQNGHKIPQMSVKFSKSFQSKALQNFHKLGFFLV